MFEILELLLLIVGFLASVLTIVDFLAKRKD